jgi:1-acyl-sn-glycerol-3-phosphate acyltransferase
MLFKTKDEARTFVGSIVRKGSSIFGRLTHYLLWTIAQLLTHILRKRTKVHGMRNVNVQRPVIFVSNHMNNWDHLRIVLSTYRHVRPLYKVQAFEYTLIRQIFIFGGAVPVAQPQKDGESLTRDKIKSAMYITRASQDFFGQLISDGWAGLVFPQGTRRPEGEAIRELNNGLWPLFQHPDTDPLIVVIGITPESMIVHKGVRLSQMPVERDLFLEDLRKRMQLALDDAIAVSK